MVDTIPRVKPRPTCGTFLRLQVSAEPLLRDEVFVQLLKRLKTELRPSRPASLVLSIHNGSVFGPYFRALPEQRVLLKRKCVVQGPRMTSCSIVIGRDVQMGEFANSEKRDNLRISPVCTS